MRRLLLAPLLSAPALLEAQAVDGPVGLDGDHRSHGGVRCGVRVPVLEPA